MEPLEAADAALLLSLVGPGDRSGSMWAAKLRVILPLAQFPDGDWWNAPDAALATGLSSGMCRRLLPALAAQKVIIREDARGGAGKVFWCRLNPDWRAWVVDWSVSSREIEARLSWARERRRREPLDRLFSRATGARSHAVIARLRARDNDALRAAQNPAIARTVRAITEPGSRALSARKIVSHAKERSLLAVAGDPTASSPSRVVDRQEEEGRRDPKFGLVAAAYAHRTGVKAVYGKPAGRLAVLLAIHGHEALLDAIQGAPEGPGVAQLVDHLEVTMGLDPSEVAAVTTATPEPVPVPPERSAPALPPIEQLLAERPEVDQALNLAGVASVRAGLRKKPGEPATVTPIGDAPGARAQDPEVLADRDPACEDGVQVIEER